MCAGTSMRCESRHIMDSVTSMGFSAKRPELPYYRRMTLHRIIVPCATAVLLVVSTAACSQDSATSSTSLAPSTASAVDSSASPSPSPRAAGDSELSTSFADGSYEVGTAVVAGKYEMAAAQSKPCTLTIKTASGDLNVSGVFDGDNDVSLDTVESGKPATYTVNSGRPSFTFENGDQVTSAGCGTWQKV